MRTPRQSAARLLLLPLAALAPLACSDRDDAPAGDAAAGDATGGTLVIATPVTPDLLFPPLALGGPAKQASDLLFDHLAEIGAELNTSGDRGFSPRLAERWTWAADSLSVAFHLHPRARWHDGRPVRASDVAFTHRLYTNPELGSPFAGLMTTVDSVTARDSLTAVAWFNRRSPEQFYEVAYQMAVLPEHLLADVKPADLRTSDFATNAPVGSGRFRFARYEPGQRLEFVSDTGNYRGRAKLDRVVWKIVPDPVTATTQLWTGEADLFEALRPDAVAELPRHPDASAMGYPALQYGFMALNNRMPGSRTRPHPVLGEREVRRALTMALDRAAIVKNVFDTLAMPAVGPGVRAQGEVLRDLRQIAVDPEAAGRLLDSLGWRDANGDGVREKGGRPLALTILTPSSSPVRVRLAVLAQEQLKRAGVAAEVEQLEFNAYIKRLEAGTFDAAMQLWSSDPTLGSVAQTWTTATAAPAGPNYWGYSNRAVDAALDSAAKSTDAARARALHARAYQAIVDDAPAIWLYEPRMVAGVHKRIRPTGARADAWWAGLADWTVDAAQRLPRDRIGIAAPGVAPQAPTP